MPETEYTERYLVQRTIEVETLTYEAYSDDPSMRYYNVVTTIAVCDDYVQAEQAMIIAINAEKEVARYAIVKQDTGFADFQGNGKGFIIDVKFDVSVSEEDYDFQQRKQQAVDALPTDFGSGNRPGVRPIGSYQLPRSIDADALATEVIGAHNPRDIRGRVTSYYSATLGKVRPDGTRSVRLKVGASTVNGVRSGLLTVLHMMKYKISEERYAARLTEASVLCDYD